MTEKRKVGIVCMRADSPLTIPGSIYDRRCAKCLTPVMIAPTGQAYLKAHPDATIICPDCLPNKYETVGNGLTAPAEEIVEEMKTMEPNLRRYRN